jgi:hypothetical protein
LIRLCEHAGQKAALFLTRKLLWITTLATFCLAAHATSSLSFDGGGYVLDLEIGDTDRPVVASVTFHRQGDAQGVLSCAGIVRTRRLTCAARNWCWSMAVAMGGWSLSR